MKRTFIGTFDKCMIVVRKSERLNRSRNNKNGGYKDYELVPLNETRHYENTTPEWVLFRKSYDRQFRRNKHFRDQAYVLTLHR